MSEIAQIDIDNTTGYYEIKRQGLWKLFLLSIKYTFRMIAQNPFTYVKIYKEVTIYRILSTYRNPNLWKRGIYNTK